MSVMTEDKPSVLWQYSITKLNLIYVTTKK